MVWSSSSTLGEALIDAGFRLRQGDSIAPHAQARLTDLSSAAYLASRPIEITVDGITLKAMAAGPTVGQALAQAGVTLAGLDRSSPSASEPIPTTRRCTRRPRARGRACRTGPGRADDDTRIQCGARARYAPGHRSRCVRYAGEARPSSVRRRSGGQPHGRRRMAGRRAPPAKSSPTGRRSSSRRSDTEYGPLQYYRAVPVYATSYSPCRSGGGRCYPGTSSGKPVQRGVIAVTHDWY